MNQKPKRAAAPQPGAADDEELAPITAMMSSRLMVLANLLKRGAILRYKRLAGLSSVEFGLVASLGRRPEPEPPSSASDSCLTSANNLRRRQGARNR